MRVKQRAQKEMVGLGGLEPPTSRLSGGRSNQAELQALQTLVGLYRLERPNGRSGFHAHGAFTN